MCCAADVEKLLVGAGFQGHWVISVCAELEASSVALMNMRPSENEDNFPGCFLFDFSCSFSKQFKVGKVTASV